MAPPREEPGSQNVGSGWNDGAGPGGREVTGDPDPTGDGADCTAEGLGSTGGASDGASDPGAGDPLGAPDPGASDAGGSLLVGSALWAGMAAATGTPIPPEATTNDSPASASTSTPAMSDRLARTPAGIVHERSSTPLSA